MAFTPRTRDQIRSDLLTAWAARYTANGRTLANWIGSGPYLLADALAVATATIEQQASLVTRDMLPDQAAGSVLDRHGAVWGVIRTAPGASMLSIILTGTPAAVIVFGSAKLISTTGLQFTPNVAGFVVPAGGSLAITFTCTSTGIGGNLVAGSVLTWDSTPVGLNPTGTVTGSPLVAGTDKETDDSYQTRILETLQGRPASGNREDWRAWAKACDGVSEAYVYPLCAPSPISPVSTGVLGCVRVVVLGPPQGTGAVNTRLITAPRAITIKGYIEGTHDIYGVATGYGTQLRPVCMSVSDYNIEPSTPDYNSLTIKIVNSAQYPFPWTPAAGLTVIFGAADQIKVVGDYHLLAGLPMLAYVGSAARGGYQYTTPSVGVFDGVNTTFSVFSPALLAVPSGTVYPGPPNFASVQSAIFNLYDSLGPNNVDPTGAVGSARWPNEDLQGRATLYRSAVEAAVQGAPGVVSVSSILDSFGAPFTDLSPTAGTLNMITLADLVIRA